MVKLKLSFDNYFFNLITALLERKKATGTITNVKNVAKVNPNMTVHARGPQKITLSPPIYTCGSPVANSEKKLMLSPMANGISPRTVVMAVNNTGRKRAFPPFTIASKISDRSK